MSQSSFIEARTLDEIWSTFRTAKEPSGHLKFGIDEIDLALNGGLPLGKVTEIYGPSGSGKTQLILSLTAEVLVNNGINFTDNLILYLYTNGTFPIDRLCEILNFKCHDYTRASNHKNKPKFDTKNMLKSLYIDKVKDYEDLYHIVSKKVNIILKSNVKLIILDSIASLYRFVPKSERAYSLLNHIIKVGSILKKIAHEYNLCVLAVNQVANIVNWQQVRSTNLKSHIKPALSYVWTSCINGRILLWRERCDLWHDGHRYFQIIFSSDAPTSQPIRFVISKRGIESVKDLS